MVSLDDRFSKPAINCMGQGVAALHVRAALHDQYYTNTPAPPTRHHPWCSDRADMCLHPACGTRIGPYVTAKSARSSSDPSLPFAPHGCSSYVRSTHAAAPAMLRSRRQVSEPHAYRGQLVTSPCLPVRNRRLTQGRRQNHLGSTRPSRLSSGTTELASISSVCGRALSRTDRSP